MSSRSALFLLKYFQTMENTHHAPPPLSLSFTFCLFTFFKRGRLKEAVGKKALKTTVRISTLYLVYLSKYIYVLICL